MIDTIKVSLVNQEKVMRSLNRLIKRGFDPSEAMRDIAGILADVAEEAFEKETDPSTGDKWPRLAEATIAQRLKRGFWPGKMLQVTGGLASSVTTDSGRDFALVGSNKEYAAIHQLGGKAGRGRKVKIPARPFLGLSDSAADEIVAVIRDFLKPDSLDR